MPFPATYRVRLSGPRSYGGTASNEPVLNGDAPDPAPGDIARGLAMYRRALVVVALFLLVLALV